MIARLVTRYPRWIVTMAVLTFVLLAAVAAGTMNALSLNRFESETAESAHAERALAAFGTGTPNVAVLVTADAGADVTDSATAGAGREAAALLRQQPGIADVRSYWDDGASPTLASADQGEALILAWAPGDADHVRKVVLPALEERLADLDTGATRIALAGSDQVFKAGAAQARTDFLRAELLILPLVVGLLWLVFRRFALALTTFAIGLFSVVATLAILRVVTAFTEVSTFAANIALVMGIALGVDYGLFLIYRFREEMRTAVNVPTAVRAATSAAGRTIVFSGATVAASVAVLFAFPFPFLSSFAYAGIAVVATAVLGATVVLPAALVLLGHRAIPRTGKSAVTRPEDGRWGRWAAAIMRRPVAALTAGVIVLLALGAPALGVNFGAPDDRIMPPTHPVRAVYDTIRAEFSTEDADAIMVVAPGGDVQRSGEYAARLSQLPGVLRVDSAAGTYAAGVRDHASPVSAARFVSGAGTWLSVLPTRAQLDDGADELVDDIRSVPAPFDIMVGGAPAMLADYTTGVVARLPLVLALIAVVTFVILFLMTGSVIAPLKATVLNLASLTVMFGVLVWVFQDGNFSDALGFTPTGSIETSIPILMFCIAYGLSMDYEVFLLSRIKEEFDRTGDTERSVVLGISRSAPLVNSAAAILAVSFLVYAGSGITFLKQLGVGMAVTVLVDATIVRGLLVPAIMRLTGAWNWWAPAPLKRLHARIGISETAPIPAAPAPLPTR
ncbi:MMPL family transporter [Nocardia sp. NPDC051832]|uniref:MMPL family transporter n=1 Tax=Nocardia sp. NPDC051832 TaxID=3155673 RepID=UPI0034174BBC